MTIRYRSLGLLFATGWVLLLPATRSVGDELPGSLHRLPPIDLTASAPPAANPRFPYSAVLAPSGDASASAYAPSAEIPPAYAPPPLLAPPHDMGGFDVGQELFPPPELEPFKRGFFQKLGFTVTGIFPDGRNGLGILETELLAAFALPAPTPESPLILSPSLQVDFVDEPAAISLPSTLYAGVFDAMWLPSIHPRALLMLAVSPGWYSDFADGDADAFRLTGRALVRYDWVPDQTQVVLGVIYLNRIRTRWLPVGGLIWKPRPDLEFDLIMPQARISRRIAWGRDYQDWVFLGGGFGGNDWAVVRPDGQRDRLSLMDWRLTLGWQRRRDGGAGLQFEAGYVFSREIRYASGDRYRPHDTFLVRGGITF